MAKLIVNTPHNGRCEDVIRIIKVLKMCKNWRVHYPVFVYRIDTSIDETLLASHYTELPELIFCVVWIKLLKKEPLDGPTLQKLSSELPKASLIFVIMVLLEASRAPSNMADIMVFISLYLDQWKDPDLLWTMLDLIDVFGSKDMACLLYKLYFDRVVVVSQQTHFQGMLLGCFRALFVKRLMYTHQPELCEDETEEKFLPKVKSLLKDRLVFNLIYALLFDCLVELQDNDEYLFLRDGKYFNFTPAELLFSKQYYEDFLENEVILELSNLAEDECILDYELDLYLSIYPMLMPDYLENKTELDSLIYTIYELASKFYKRSYDKIEDFKLNHVDTAYVDYYKKLIIETCKEWHKFDVYDVN